MKMAVILSTAGLIALAVATPQAVAAPRIVGNYYEDYIIGNCFSDGNGLCSYNLSQLPTLSRPYTLTLTEIACNVKPALEDSPSVQLKQMWLSVTDGGQNERRKHPIPTPTPTPKFTIADNVAFEIFMDCTAAGTITYN